MNWRKSSYSGNNGTCVEVANLNRETVLVRNSKKPDSLPLAFTSAEIQAFLLGVKAGEFDDLIS